MGGGGWGADTSHKLRRGKNLKISKLNTTALGQSLNPTSDMKYFIFWGEGGKGNQPVRIPISFTNKMYTMNRQAKKSSLY